MDSNTLIAAGAVLTSALGAIFGLYQARKADRSANSTKAIELGVTNLVDQYRKANEELNERVHEAETRIDQLEHQNRMLTRQVEELQGVIEEKDIAILRLKNKYGEPLT